MLLLFLPLVRLPLPLLFIDEMMRVSCGMSADTTCRFSQIRLGEWTIDGNDGTPPRFPQHHSRSSTSPHLLRRRILHRPRTPSRSKIQIPILPPSRDHSMHSYPRHYYPRLWTHSIVPWIVLCFSNLCYWTVGSVFDYRSEGEGY